MFTYFLTTLTAYNPFGEIDAPVGVIEYGRDVSNFGTFIANIIRLLIVAAGIFAVFNFVLAGYGFLSAGGDPKRVADAWTKIWQSILGLLFVAGAFVIGMIVSQILFGDPREIFRIRIYGP